MPTVFAGESPVDDVVEETAVLPLGASGAAAGRKLLRCATAGTQADANRCDNAGRRERQQNPDAPSPHAQDC